MAGGHFYHEEAASRAALLADVAHRALGALGARPASAAVGPPLAPPERHVHEMVCEWAARTPDAPALVDGATALSYAELAADARLLACWLVAAGARPRTVVGCLMEHRSEAVVAQLAAGLSGAAFFGMETHFGPKMLAELLEQSRPVALLASAATRARAEGALPTTTALLDVDAGWREAAAAAAAAVAPPEAWARAAPYDGGIITMTSGTSGKPKAIVCPHAAYAHAAAARQARHPYAAGGGYGGEREGVNVMFAWEALRPLCYGQTAVVIPDDVVIDTPRLVDFIADRRLTRLLTTPSLLSTLLETAAADADAGAAPPLAARLPELALWLLCGEVVPTALARAAAAALPHAALVNDYSSWEGSDVATPLCTTPPRPTRRRTPPSRPNASPRWARRRRAPRSSSSSPRRKVRTTSAGGASCRTARRASSSCGRR